MTPPRSDLRSPPPQGGAASGPAEPVPRRPLEGHGSGTGRQEFLSLEVNGQRHALPGVPHHAPLLQVLRNDLCLNGPKYGCGLGECGACLVLIDGTPARSCVIPAGGVQDRAITTLEGLPARAGARIHPVQQAFIDARGWTSCREGLRDSVDRHVLEARLSAARTQLERELGPVFPRLQLSTSPSVDAGTYEILVHDVAVSAGRLRPGWLLLDAGGPAVPTGSELVEPFGPFARPAWALQAPPGAAALPGENVIARHVEQVVRDHAWRLLGLQEVHRLLAIVQREAPELAAEVSRALPPQRLAEVLRRLLQEGIPIRNLQGICESLTLWAAKEPDTIALTELVRIDLGRFITSRHVGPNRKLAAILFEPSLLERVQGSVERSPRGNLLLLSPTVAEDVRTQLQALLAKAAGPVVAIASAETRRYLKTLIEPVAPQLAVLSYQEVDDDVQLQPVGWISNPQAA